MTKNKEDKYTHCSQEVKITAKKNIVFLAKWFFLHIPFQQSKKKVKVKISEGKI